MSDIAQWPKTCKTLYNDTFYQFKKFTTISRFLCVKQLWILHIVYLQALKELYYSPQQKILISIFECQTRVVFPGQKPSAKLYLLILSLLLSFVFFIIVVFVLFCFLFQFTLCLLCSCFLRSSAEKVCYCPQKLHILYTNIRKCIFLPCYCFYSCQYIFWFPLCFHLWL